MSTSLSSVVLAIAFLGLLAGVVAPTVTSSDTARLESAAFELAALMRMARAESIRLGEPHGVVFNETEQSFKVSQVDATTEPFVPVATTYHVVRKQPLSFSVGWAQITPSADVFDYGVYGRTNYLMFDAWGTPVLNVGGVRRRLETSAISINLGNQSQAVQIEAHTGRVVVL